MKKYFLVILILLLVSCSSNPKITQVGPGVITTKQEILSKEEVKQQKVKQDTLTGAGIGAGSGALIGAGGTYAYVSNQDNVKGQYKFEVIQDGQTVPIAFEQFPDRDYIVGDKVYIYKSQYKGSDTYFIKPFAEPDKN